MYDYEHVTVTVPYGSRVTIPNGAKIGKLRRLFSARPNYRAGEYPVESNSLYEERGYDYRVVDDTTIYYCSGQQPTNGNVTLIFELIKD